MTCKNLPSTSHFLGASITIHHFTQLLWKVYIYYLNLRTSPCHHIDSLMLQQRVEIIGVTYSKIPLIWLAQDWPGAELLNIPDYQMAPILTTLVHTGNFCYCPCTWAVQLISGVFHLNNSYSLWKRLWTCHETEYGMKLLSLLVWDHQGPLQYLLESLKLKKFME